MSGFNTKGKETPYVSRKLSIRARRSAALPAPISHARAVLSDELFISSCRISIFDSPMMPPFFWFKLAIVGNEIPRYRMPSQAHIAVTGA